jgi:hypothetical protein
MFPVFSLFAVIGVIETVLFIVFLITMTVTDNWGRLFYVLQNFFRPGQPLPGTGFRYEDYRDTGIDLDTYSGPMEDDFEEDLEEETEDEFLDDGYDYGSLDESGEGGEGEGPDEDESPDYDASVQGLISMINSISGSLGISALPVDCTTQDVLNAIEEVRSKPADLPSTLELAFTEGFNAGTDTYDSAEGVEGAYQKSSTFALAKSISRIESELLGSRATREPTPVVDKDAEIRRLRENLELNKNYVISNFGSEAWLDIDKVEEPVEQEPLEHPEEPQEQPTN